MQTPPEDVLLIIAFILLLFLLNIYNANGFSFLFINSITSSISLKSKIGSKGPKISSLYIFDFLLILSRRVGSIKFSFSFILPPYIMFEPSCFASSSKFINLLKCFLLTILQ